VRTRQRTETGATVLEFALVVPLVLATLLGTLQYGLHYWARETGAASAREAARRMSVGTDWACTRAEALAKVSNPAVGGTTPTASMRYDDATDTAVVGQTVTVTVRFASLDMGLFPLPSHGIVSESATARVENVPGTALGCG
jgi:Flp pilus assembly protein TadG